MKIVAIDGLAGSGKSTVCQRLAERFNWLHFSTGIVYRTVAVIVRQLKLSDCTEAAVGKILEQELPAIDWNFTAGEARIEHRTLDLTDKLHSADVSELASVISAWPAVRRPLLTVQRAIVASAPYRGAIVDGRDIGTVVFPDADLKIFMIADLERRAKRRAIDDRCSTAESRQLMARRDQRDQERQFAPLKMAQGAIKFDTTELTVEQSSTALAQVITERLGLTLS